MSTNNSSKIMRLHEKRKTAIVDNSHFQFRDQDQVIADVYSAKWLHAFLTTRDPMNWLLNRQQSQRRLRFVRTSS